MAAPTENQNTDDLDAAGTGYRHFLKKMWRYGGYGPYYGGYGPAVPMVPYGPMVPYYGPMMPYWG